MTQEERDYWDWLCLQECGISYTELERRSARVRAGHFITHVEAMKQLEE